MKTVVRIKNQALSKLINLDFVVTFIYIVTFCDLEGSQEWRRTDAAKRRKSQHDGLGGWKHQSEDGEAGGDAPQLDPAEHGPVTEDDLSHDHPRPLRRYLTPTLRAPL